MAFRFNYTDRRKINLSEVEIRTVPGEPRLTVYLACDFKAAKYAAEDVLVVEAYRFTKAQRKELGALGSLANKTKIVFDAFADATQVKYRLKVVDPVTKKLKSLAKSVRPSDKPEQPSDLEPILPVAIADAEDGLGDAFWKVGFPAAANGPVLFLNGRQLTHESVKSNEFKALVWPAALADVLTEIVIRNASSYPSWAAKWMTFVNDVLGVGDAPEEWNPEKEEFASYVRTAADWIDSARCAFAAHFALRSVSIKGLTKEDAHG